MSKASASPAWEGEKIYLSWCYISCLSCSVTNVLRFVRLLIKIGTVRLKRRIKFLLRNVSSTNPVLSTITEARGTMAVDITIVCMIMNDNHSRVDNIFIVLRQISSERSDRDWFLSMTLKSMLTVLSSGI